jgi:glucan biosynthesis protein C
MTPNHHRDLTIDCWRIWLACLGVVFHAVYLYPVHVLHDVTHGSSWQWTFWTILSNGMHVFRVPMFFIISGYSARSAIHCKGLQNFLQNRYQRILKPLVGFGLCMNLTLASSALTMLLVAWVSSQHLWLNAWDALSKMQLYHLWFLWYLVVMTLLDCGLTPATRAITKKLHPHSIPIIWVIMFCALTASKLNNGGQFWTYYPKYLAFDWRHFFYGCTFYMVGRLYPFDEIRSQINRHQVAYAMSILLLLSVMLLSQQSQLLLPPSVVLFAQSTLTWLVCFFLLANGKLLCATPLARLRAFSDSAYWVYLFHLPCIVWLYQAYPATILKHPSWCVVLTINLSFCCTSISFKILKQWPWFFKHIASGSTPESNTSLSDSVSVLQ